MTKQEMLARRLQLIADARKLDETASAEKRDLTSEERSNWDLMMAEVDKLKEQIDRQERVERAASEAERSAEAARESAQRNRQVDTPVVDPSKAVLIPVERRHNETAREHEDRTRRSQPGYMAAFRSFLANGLQGLNGHLRAIQADVDIVGGYLVMPEMFVAELLKFVDNIVFMRQKSRKFTLTTAASLGVPELTADPADADWTSELATGNEDSTMAFGKRALYPHPLAKRIKVSNKFMRLSAINPEMEVKERLGYKFGVTQEKGFMTGNGVNQPLGVFTASASGVSTGRDVTVGTTTAITADGLIDVKYALKWQYQVISEWIFHRDAMKQIRKLKDGQGQYIWQPGLVAGQPDQLLDRPVNMSEYAPNTFTSGLYVGMLYAPQYYWIAEVMQMQMQKLVELYAETDQTGFIARAEIDGMPALEEAFSRAKLA